MSQPPQKTLKNKWASRSERLPARASLFALFFSARDVHVRLIVHLGNEDDSAHHAEADVAGVQRCANTLPPRCASGCLSSRIHLA